MFKKITDTQMWSPINFLLKFRGLSCEYVYNKSPQIKLLGLKSLGD